MQGARSVTCQCCPHGCGKEETLQVYSVWSCMSSANIQAAVLKADDDHAGIDWVRCLALLTDKQA